MMVTDQQYRLDALMVFCRRHGTRLFPGWSDADLERWLLWHAANQCLVQILDRNGRILGMAAGRPTGTGPVVHFLFEKVIAVRPFVLGQMVREFRQRFPQWRSWQLIRDCGGSTRPVPAAWLERVERLNS